MNTTLVVEKVFDGTAFHHQCAVQVANGKIVAMESGVDADNVIPGLLAPGFVDVQVNGGGGAFFNATPTIGAIKTIAQAHTRYGTTALLPTLITDEVSVIEQAAQAMATAIAEKTPGVLGIHFEGPHLSVPKKGVHPAEHIRSISDIELDTFSRQDLGKVMVTLAPENVPADIIRELVGKGVHVCLGHSNADVDTVNAALEAGATGFTHLFNAMSPFESRAPGMVGAALLDESSWCGLIVDGYHVHPQSARLAIKAKVKGKMMLVTDAMSLVGTDESSFHLFGDTVVRRGDRLNASDGALAGSMLDMASAVRNTVNDVKIDLTEALNMASRNPAAFLGLDKHIGQLAVGMQADMVLLNDNLLVEQCWIGGNPELK